MSADVLEALLGAARQAGADAADAMLINSMSVSVERRLGQMEHLERSESRDLGLRVFLGQRSAVVSASSVDPARFADLAARAVAMARVVPEDPFAFLSDQAAPPDDVAPLDMVDDAEPDIAALIERAQTAEEAALRVTGVTNSEGGSAGFGRTDVFLATSAGFFGGLRLPCHATSGGSGRCVRYRPPRRRAGGCATGSDTAENRDLARGI
jgi:PmbA protein